MEPQYQQYQQEYMNPMYQGQMLQAAGPPAPCTSLAGCEFQQPEQPNYQEPASAPQYNSPEGMTYTPTTTSGVSATDQSPDIPKSFLDEEAKSQKRMKRLKDVLKKSRLMQDTLDGKVKKLQEYLLEEKTAIKNEVVQLNQKDTDSINAPYHDIVGPRGPPGPPGVNGLAAANGINGAPGPEGPRGKQGSTGATGVPGPRGPKGRTGVRGVIGIQGDKGVVGPGGVSGPQGPEDGASLWGAGKYFCPGGATEYMRLVDCNTASCRLETKYNQVWGSVCDSGFTQKSAETLCHALGYPEGGMARRHGGGAGPIWLSRVSCTGKEGDIGDCPKSCGAPGCGHGNDVGLCCFGFVRGSKGKRKNVRSSFKTVKDLRSQCYTPDACPAIAKGQKTVALKQNCGAGGWSATLPKGKYSRFSGGQCDDDSAMCAVSKCGIVSNQLGSMDIPEGLAVKLYDGEAFTGGTITYYGPRRVDCLSYEGWQNKASSLQIVATGKRPRSSWTMRVFKSSGGGLNSMPSTPAMEYVGQGAASYINFHSSAQVRTAVAATPDYNYMVEFFGNIKVKQGGKYEFCTISSDGSYMYMSKLSDIIVSNGGRHATRKVCATRTLKSGSTYHIIVRFFKGASGGSVIQAMWKGPDTLNNLMLLRSADGLSSLPPTPRKSSWALRMFKSTKGLRVIPDVGMVTKVGEASGIKWVYYTAYSQFQSIISATPTVNYVWVFYGSARIEKKGKYTFCSTSDDGSRLLVDGWLVVNNDGLHGPRKYCGARDLDAGDHEVVVEGFQAGGGVYQRVTYSGPDTGGAEVYLQSVGSKAGDLPKLPPPSSFTLRMYSNRNAIASLPDERTCDYVGEGLTPYIDFYTLQEFQKIVPKTPSSRYVWVFFGNLDIKRAGTYRFCSTSDDGSMIWLNGQLVVNNDGLHGAVRKCGDISLKAGWAEVKLSGFQNYGGVYQTAHWSGPDTGGVERFLRSDKPDAPKKPAPSEWLLRMFSASNTLYRMSDANINFLKFVGEKYVPDIDYRNYNDFKAVIPNLPTSRYAWVFYGKIKIKTKGKYLFCTVSDDGSFLFVDNVKVVDLDGLHGAYERCGYKDMTDGDHEVRIEGFQNAGGAYQSAYYSGPDTYNKKIQMVAYKTKAPALPPPSVWKLRVYSTSYTPIQVMPDVTKMTFAGEANVEYIRFKNTNELKALVSQTPNQLYAWIGYGKLDIKTAGTYSLCSISDDGSYLYVDKKMIVNNDGLHGAVNKCASTTLSKGLHEVLIAGFQNYGGVYQDASYSGPDTLNTYKPIRSAGHWAPSNVASTPYTVGRWPPTPPPSYKPGAWPAGYCNPPSAACTQLGIKDNMCGTCTALPGGGIRLENSHGIRFDGASFDDNQIGKGSYQAMNICTLARYGNGGTITKKPTADCGGYSIYSSANSQVHWYGNCAKGDSSQAHCCSNAELLKSGFDWKKFSKGNSCSGDNDRDYTLGKVDCFFEK